MHCCCPLCGKKLGPGSGTFFSVPQDQEKRDLWSKVCKKKFVKSTRICIDHFSKEHIITAGSRRFLMPKAIPVVQQQENMHTSEMQTMHTSEMQTMHTSEMQTMHTSEMHTIEVPLCPIDTNEPFVLAPLGTAASRCAEHPFKEKESQTERNIIVAAPKDPENAVFQNQEEISQNVSNVNNNVMHPQLQEEPIIQIPVIKSISCSGSTQTNTRLCGLVETSDFANEFRFNCFYCSEVFPIEKWKKFIIHLKNNHFESEEAFKESRYVSDDHDYTPLCFPSSITMEAGVENVAVNNKSVPSFLVDPLEPTYNPFECIVLNPTIYYTPDKNKADSQNINNEISSSVSEMPVSGMKNKWGGSKKEQNVCGNKLPNESILTNNESKQKLISSEALNLGDSYQETSTKTALSKSTDVKEMDNTECEEQCESISIGIGYQNSTEISFEYTPSEVVNSLLDSMKNYPVLWQFDGEPFNEDFFDAAEDLCKIINEKWSLNIDNLKMRRSINRILRLYCYLYQNEDENIHQFTCYYDKLAAFLPSSVSDIAYARCSHCYICYMNDFNLKLHLVEEQKYLEWPYKCEQCKECFRENEEYEFHKRLPHYDKIFTCGPCNKTFFHRNLYSRHIVVSHLKDNNEPDKYKCDMCDKEFPTRSTLRYHKILHGEKKYKCHLCPKSYFENVKLTLHLKSHRKEYDYMCEVCGKGFLVQAKLREHMKMHTGAKVTCNICNLRLRKSSLSRHLRIVHHVANIGNVEASLNGRNHYYRRLIRSKPLRPIHRKSGERNYRCKTCKISFGNYKLIVEHNKKLHSNTPKWPCKMCSTEFSHKLNLKSHYRRKHNLHVIQAFKLVDENEDLDVVLAMETEYLDQLEEYLINSKNKLNNVTKSNISPVKSDLLPQIYVEEKIHSSTIQDEIMEAADNIETQEIQIELMNDFFTDLFKEN